MTGQCSQKSDKLTLVFSPSLPNYHKSILAKLFSLLVNPRIFFPSIPIRSLSSMLGGVPKKPVAFYDAHFIVSSIVTKNQQHLTYNKCKLLRIFFIDHRLFISALRASTIRLVHTGIAFFTLLIDVVHKKGRSSFCWVSATIIKLDAHSETRINATFKNYCFKG